jgi:hypothetical protein
MDGLNNFTDGSNAGQWSNSGSTAQQWVLEAAGTYVKIKNRASGLYLDGAGNTTNGAVVKQTVSSTSLNQQWQQLPSGSYMKFKNRGTGQYIDGLGLTANPSNLGQWKKSSSSNQEWIVGNVPGARMAAVAPTNESKLQVQLNPNPFTSSLNLKVSRPEEVTSITIFDASGRRVQTIEHSAVSNTMSVGASLKSGIYVVKVNGVNGVKSFKVVKK